MLFCVQVLLLGISLILLVRSETVYKTVNMECFPNDKYIRNTTCKLKAINRYKAVSNMDCDIVGELRNVSLNLQLYIKNNANIYRPHIVNVTSNLCDILAKKAFPVYTTIIMKIMKQVSNVNHSCPYYVSKVNGKKGGLKVLRSDRGHLKTFNLYLPERFVPNFLPPAIYKWVFHFMEGYPYDDIGTVILYIEAIEKDDLRPKRRKKNFQRLK